MIVSKGNLEVYRVADSSDGRYSLSNVLVEPDGTTVAADGAYMLAVSPPDKDTRAMASAYKGFSRNGVKSAVQIPADAVKEARKALPNKSAADTELQRHTASIAVDDDGVHLTTSGERTRTVTADPGDGQWPDYSSIIPDPDGSRPVVTFDARRMKDLCDAMLRVAGGTKSKASELAVAMTVQDRESPFMLRARSDDGQDMIGLLSPIVPEHDVNSDGMPQRASEWETFLDAPADVRHTIADAPSCREEILALHDIAATADARAERLSEQWTYVQNIVQGAAIARAGRKQRAADTDSPAVKRAEEHVHNTVRRFHGAAAPMAG